MENSFIKDVRAGDRPSASQQNLLIESVNRLNHLNTDMGLENIWNLNGVFPIIPPVQTTGFRFKNETESTIPPYGVIRLNGMVSGSTTLLSGKKPNTFGSQYRHFINGSQSVAVNSTGICYNNWGKIKAAYNPLDGTPVQGEAWGPRADSFLLHKDTGGFQIFGRVDTSAHTVIIIQQPMLSFQGIAADDIADSLEGPVEIDSEIVYITASYGSIVNGAIVWCMWDQIEQVWKGIQVRCPPPTTTTTTTAPP